jgi:Uma2 family endonuclease
VDAYQRLAELGVLPDDARVELIDGQVVEMSPIGDRHANCVRRLLRVFSQRVADVAIIDVQNTLVLGPHDAPQPDLTMLKLRADAYPTHPRAADALLVIEVADTSVAYDRDVKIPRYAAAGIPEAWLLDLGADVISVYRGPEPHGYRDVVTVVRRQTLRPLFKPELAIRADDVLGQAPC